LGTALRQLKDGTPMNKIRKGDQVIVLTGKDKGRKGTVLGRDGDDRLVVEGVNVVKKHVKPNPMKGITGGVIDKTLSIHQSNVAIFNAATGKADRVGVKLLGDDEMSSRKTAERRVRVYRSSGEEIKV
jgi:large subunit ribosomal protein L24